MPVDTPVPGGRVRTAEAASVVVAERDQRVEHIGIPSPAPVPSPCRFGAKLPSFEQQGAPRSSCRLSGMRVSRPLSCA